MIIVEQLRRFDGLSLVEFTFPSYRPLLLAADQDGAVIGLRALLDGKVAGLALASLNSPSGAAELHSVFVSKDCRGRGVGSRLIDGLAHQVRQRGGTRLETRYLADGPGTDGFERLMAKCGWDEPQFDRLLVRCGRNMLNASWMIRAYPLPSRFSLFSWADFNEGDRARLQRSQAAENWIPYALDPFAFDKSFAFNSIGIRLGEDVIGWVLTEIGAGGTLRYSCSFIRQEYQRLGRIVPAYQEAVRRHATRIEEFPEALWVVPAAHPRMVDWVRRWASQDAYYVRDHRVCWKALDVS